MFELPKVGEEIDTYDGSRAFTWLANMTGLSVDLVSTFTYSHSFITTFSLYCDILTII